MKKAILLTLLISQPALALDMEARARDYTSWLNNNENKTITIRVSNQPVYWKTFKANNILLDELNGVFFTEKGKRKFYHGPFMVEE